MKTANSVNELSSKVEYFLDSIGKSELKTQSYDEVAFQLYNEGEVESADTMRDAALRWEELVDQ